MEFTNSLAYILSSHLCSLTLMWEIPHGGEKPHLSLRLCLIWPFIITWIPISPTDLIPGQIRDHLPEVFLLIVAQRKENKSDVSASSEETVYQTNQYLVFKLTKVASGLFRTVFYILFAVS